MTMPFSQYDARHYTTLDVSAGYAAWSSTYDQTADPQLDIALLEQLRTVDWKSIQTAVDLACGTGRIGQWLRRQGIMDIDGVDCCPSMLQHATNRHIYERLHEADITRLPLPDHAFDLGISVLATCHLADLPALYREAARVVRPNGWFVVLDYHPFFLLRGIPTHFRGANGPIAIENVVHLTSDHINSGIQNGWIPAEMHERVVDPQWAGEKPNLARHVNQPISFVVLWRKGSLTNASG